MFSTLFKNEPQNLYVGTLAVAPDDNLASVVSYFSFGFSDLDVIVVGNRGGDMFNSNKKIKDAHLARAANYHLIWCHILRRIY